MKYQVKSYHDLQNARKAVELDIHQQEMQIKHEVSVIKENLQPENLVKNTFSRLAESPGIQRTLINTVIGIAIGYASKKVVTLLSEQSLDNMVHNLADAGLSKLEHRYHHNLFGKTITLLRNHTPESSPMYKFIGNKKSY